MIGVREARSRFPSLSSGFVFLDNAGGTQVPMAVVEAMSRYLVESYAQVGGRYPHSLRAMETIERARDFTRQLVGDAGVGEVVFGSSASVLLRWLADAIGLILRPGDEVVVAESNHEANIGPWLRLERQGARVVWWQVDCESGALEPGDLERLVTEKTRLVAMPHASNILGRVECLSEAVRCARSVGALVVADGVAYAPHRRMRVAEWDVDFYVLSCYKVFGPHMAALWGRRQAIERLTGPNHFFLQRGPLPQRWELGGPNHEACAGWLAVGEHLAELAGSELGSDTSLDVAYQTIQRLETEPMAQLLQWLSEEPRVRLVGPASLDADRLPTVSFVPLLAPHELLCDAAARDGIGIKHGHFFAYRLMEAMGIEPGQGVVRVSLAHYNTIDEVDRLRRAIEPVLG